MRLAKYAFLIALVTLAMVFAVSAQTMRNLEDTRNTAPTVGTGGPTGGPTGLFTIYDGQTLRKGEYTFSVAYSNFDRDPGNADFTEVPVSFQIGLSDGLELFFNTDAYRGIKVNNPQNLSSFYLPNSQLVVGTVPGAIVLAPGTSGVFANTAVFRPAGAPFVQFPYSGGAVGLYGNTLAPGALFGTTTLGPVRAGGASDNFPGVGSVFGSILPGIVLATVPVAAVTTANLATTAPSVFSLAPSYLPDAPFINRRYGQSAFSTYNAGAKWRFTGPNNPVGFGVMAYYRWYNDNAADTSGFNQLQRGASPGGNRGDIGATLFADVRAAKWANISGNLGYVYNSSVKGEFPNGTFTLLDRPDELQYGVGVDFPVNQYFQPIIEFRQTKYVGGRTPNVFENDPMDVLGGVRIYPKRWFGFGFAYRYHANSQDDVGDSTFSSSARLVNSITGGTVSTTATSGSLANVFRTSTDPHGFIVQFWAGRRNERGKGDIPVAFADVSSVDLDSETVILPCPAGTKSAGACADDTSVGVKTSATNPANDVLTYNYTVSGGRIVGSGSGVNWDLSGVKPGTYTITSAVDNGCGFCGKTQTKTIVVKDCADCKPICNCPDSFTVMGPSSVTRIGDSMTFTANMVGGDQANVTYNWTVSGGTITSGQGTPSISVSTDASLAGQTVTATAEAGGLCTDCGAKTASASGEVETPKVNEPRKIDEIGPAVADDLKQRLDSLRIELNNDPTARGFIINTGSAKERAKRNKDLISAMAFLQIDASRVTVEDRGGSTPVKSEIWIVPAGAPNP